MTAQGKGALLCCGAVQAGRLLAELESALSGWPPCVWKTSGAACREVHAQMQPALSVVGPGIEDVTPVNLVAALSKDAREGGYEAPIVLVDPTPSGSLASRARGAGAVQVTTFAGLAPLLTTLAADAPTMEQVQSERTTKLADPGRVVVFTSGRGGVGASTMATLFAIAAQRHGIDTLLFDLDAQCGEIAYALGGEDVARIADPFARDGSIVSAEKLAQKVDGGVHLLAPPLEKDAFAEVEAVLGPFIEHARESYRLVVVDAGAVWGPAHVDVMNAADFVLFAMDQRPASVRACHEAAEFAYRLGVPSPRMGFVLNRCAQGCAITSLDAAVALGGAHVYELPEGGEDVDARFGAGQPSQLFSEDNPLAVECGQLFIQIAELLGLGGELGESGRRLRPRTHGFLRRRRKDEGGESS